ncbi:beta/gamma crystallin domain-containing protein [Amycolatopsis rifamycinica]|uniref:beta/gamma crystallin domain-containing protein n=1 Tax=Amycolatopsis rifamycinica TaxID=287986 RepID=UPI000A9D03A8|nr:beta/gamma crystallin domain-containing protein [Amycolatopsis rifamycinica]
MAKRSTLTVLAVAAMTAAIPAGAASATNRVSCNSDEFVRVRVHPSNFPTQTLCFANAGSMSIETLFKNPVWITEVWTGNNRVQWHGDGRWQPSTPIAKRTAFTWPNHPGGVRIDQIRIL